MVLLLPLLVISCSALPWTGHTVSQEVMKNHDRDFDFRRLPCRPAARCATSQDPEDAVVLRYLGVSGLYVEWRNAAILAGPFFSNPGMIRVGLARARSDLNAIAAGLDGIPTERVDAILAGHSHYDHLGDVAAIVEHHTPQAEVYANRSGVNVLEAWDLKARGLEQSRSADGAIWLQDREGRRLPIRVFLVPSEHAPHVDGYCWRCCRLDEPWSRRKAPRFRHLVAGRVYAFVIDLMSSDPKTPRFRIFYQDSVNPGEATPYASRPPELGPEPIDLAVITMASFYKADDHPEQLVAAFEPRHVLVTHYENFFRDRARRILFAPLITNRRANTFLERLSAAMETVGPGGGPSDPSCGPSSDRWTMPLPGEWLHFRPAVDEEATANNVG